MTDARTRVYLMADFGKGPRVAKEWRTKSDKTLPGSVPAKALRWWLVEADSADAARQGIDAYETGREMPEPDNRCAGRILDSGGSR
jgi:hypothetical protein